MKINRVWHPYTKWEDYLNGMWSTIHGKQRKKLLERAYKFTGNAELYGSFMMRVINEWQVSCEHNLTNLSSNRRAWIGHAACALAFNCPEDITRQAWGFLTDQQRDEANYVADLAIMEWENNYVRKDS